MGRANKTALEMQAFELFHFCTNQRLLVRIWVPNGKFGPLCSLGTEFALI